MNGEPPLPPSDAEHDAWLRAALRHAPDAADGAPPALGAAILRAAESRAREAASARRRPAGDGWWSAAWAWLARPSIGTAFAGIVVATTVGLLWHREPLPEAPRPAPRMTIAPEAPTSRAAAPAPDTATAPAAPAPPATAAPPVTAATPAPQAAPAAPAQAAEPTQTTPRSRAAARDDAARAGQAPAIEHREAAPAAPAAPAPLAKRRAAPAEATRDTAASEATASMAAPLPAPPPTASADSAARTPAVAAARAPLNERLAVVAPVQSLAHLRAAIAAEPGAWTWQRAGSPARPAGDAMAAWLAAVDAAAGRRWTTVAGSAEAEATADAVVLLHDGRVAHRLSVGPDRVRWDTLQGAAGGQRWQATLPPPDARALQAQLGEATR